MNRFYIEESLNVGVSESTEDSIIPGYEVCNDFCHIAVKHLVRLRSIMSGFLWSATADTFLSIIHGKYYGVVNSPRHH